MTSGTMGGSEWCEFAGTSSARTGRRCPVRGTLTALVDGDRPRQEDPRRGRARAGRVPGADLHGVGRLPHFGPFSAIADLAKRLFNLRIQSWTKYCARRHSAC